MRRIILITAALVLGACSDTPQKTVYQHDQCHRLNLFDQDKGLEILGTEDIVRLPDGDLLVSAYDRRSRDESGIPPEGGLYLIPKNALDKKTLHVSSVIKSLSGGLRPHGLDAIAMGDKSVRVAFVNRGYTPKNQNTNDQDLLSSVAIASFELIDDKATALKLRTGPFCRANDLALFNPAPLTPQSDEVFITIDREHCSGVKAILENMIGTSFASGGWSQLSWKALYSNSRIDNQGRELLSKEHKHSFPNGIGIQFPDRPLGDNNFLAIAETRANRISYYPKTPDRDIIILPGSPDNLTIWRPGIILAALHPSLMRLALYRYKWPGFSRAPSRVVKVSGTQVLMLFDDPTGALFSAASVAVQTAGKLVLGSVGDSGLLVCGGRTSS